MDSTEEQVAQKTPRASLDAWSWIARAREAAARTVAPVAPGAEPGGEPAADPAAEPDSDAG